MLVLPELVICPSPPRPPLGVISTLDKSCDLLSFNIMSGKQGKDNRQILTHAKSIFTMGETAFDYELQQACGRSRKCCPG